MKKSKTKNSGSGGVGRCDVMCTACVFGKERAASTTLQLAGGDKCQFETNLLQGVRKQHACYERVMQHEKADGGHSERQLRNGL
jgi:hypothetical protein